LTEEAASLYNYNMNLATQILTNIIENHKKTKININIPKKDIEKIFSDTCYKALSEIHSLVKDESLSDFMRIEGIVQVFERLGCDDDLCHDF